VSSTRETDERQMQRLRDKSEEGEKSEIIKMVSQVEMRLDLIAFPINTHFQFNNKIIRCSFYFYHFYLDDKFLDCYTLHFYLDNKFLDCYTLQSLCQHVNGEINKENSYEQTREILSKIKLFRFSKAQIFLLVTQKESLIYWILITCLSLF